MVLFLEKVLIPVQPYLEWLHVKALASNCRNPSFRLDGGKSLKKVFLVFVHCFTSMNSKSILEGFGKNGFLVKTIRRTGQSEDRLQDTSVIGSLYDKKAALG